MKSLVIRLHWKLEGHNQMWFGVCMKSLDCTGRSQSDVVWSVYEVIRLHWNVTIGTLYDTHSRHNDRNGGPTPLDDQRDWLLGHALLYESVDKFKDNKTIEKQNDKKK